jgi:hypothetical protein
MAFNYFEIERILKNGEERETWIFKIAVNDPLEVNLCLESYEKRRWFENCQKYIAVTCAGNDREFAELNLKVPKSVERRLRRAVIERIERCEIVLQGNTLLGQMGATERLNKPAANNRWSAYKGFDRTVFFLPLKLVEH